MEPVTHRYGPQLELLSDPYLLTLLARIGAPETTTATMPALVRTAYRRMAQELLAREFPVEHGHVRSRMAATEPRAFYDGPMLCARTRLVICAVIRAGILPAEACYELACEVLPPENVRIDFLNMSRVCDERGQVVGVRMDGSKIGGTVEDAIVLVPDPMGATGGTLARVHEAYAAFGGALARRFLALHLIVTPEAVQRLQQVAPAVRVYAGRFDRGLSPAEVLRTVPGTHPELERGLDDMQYVIPGAGGLGELLTNSWV
jgi:uracil phosphoribosyltransferase